MNLFVDLIYSVRAFTPSLHPSQAADPTLPTPARIAVMSAVLIGIVLGSFVVALIRKDLMVDRFADREDVRRHIIGGVLMGIGGVMAYGCTFGQGLSGFATLSVTSLIAIAAMIAGCLWGVRALEAGSAWGGLRLCFGRLA